MDQQILDLISFYGRVIDDLHEKIEQCEKELKLEEEVSRINMYKRFITGFKSSIRYYKAEQKILAFNH